MSSVSYPGPLTTTRFGTHSLWQPNQSIEATASRFGSPASPEASATATATIRTNMVRVYTRTKTFTVPLQGRREEHRPPETAGEGFAGFLEEMKAAGHGALVDSTLRSVGREIRRREGKCSLASLRLARGMTQADLAARLGTSQPYVARLEAGEHSPRASRLKQLGEILGVSTNTVLEAFDGDQPSD